MPNQRRSEYSLEYAFLSVVVNITGISCILAVSSYRGAAGRGWKYTLSVQIDRGADTARHFYLLVKPIE